MIQVVATIAPVFLLIVTGFACKRKGFPGDAFWTPAERLSYYVFLPALIVHSLAAAELGGIQLGPMVATAALLTAALTLIAIILRPVLGVDGPGFTSVIQGTIRLNSYLGFAIAAAFFGPEGVAVTAVFVAFMMPMANVVSITALTVFGTNQARSWTRIPIQIVTNPLILACVLGALVNALDLPTPIWAMGALALLGKAALPIALLCVGAGLDLSMGRTGARAIAVTSLTKLIAAPVLAWALIGVTGLSGLGLSIAMMMASTPVSPASYVLARQLGGDAGLMAGLITVQTALSAITLSLVLGWRTGAISF